VSKGVEKILRVNWVKKILGVKSVEKYVRSEKGVNKFEVSKGGVKNFTCEKGVKIFSV